MKNNQILVGIHGAARSGKGETAKYLKKFHAFKEDSFADPIRRFFIDLLALKGMDELDEIKSAEEPLDILGGKTLRYAMQTMGTDWARNTLSDSLWIDTCLGRVKKYERAVISDVRFDNEAQAVKDAGGFIIMTRRPNVEIKGSSHPSEAGIDLSFIDYYVDNDACLEHLTRQVEIIMKDLFNKVYK